MSRLLSLVVAVGYMISIIFEHGFTDMGFTTMIMMVLFLLLPLSLIWFGSEWGGLYFRHISKGSPGWAVSFVGWLLLLLFPVLSILGMLETKG